MLARNIPLPRRVHPYPLTLPSAVKHGRLFLSQVYVMYGESFLSLNVLDGNNNTAYANYTSGNGTSELLFAYTVESGDVTDRLDYSSPASDALVAPFGDIVAKDTLGPVYLRSLPEPGTTGSLGWNTDIVVSDEVLLVEGVRERICLVYLGKSHRQYWVLCARMYV